MVVEGNKVNMTQGRVEKKKLHSLWELSEEKKKDCVIKKKEELSEGVREERLHLIWDLGIINLGHE